jgi:hypothetical protein
MFAWSNPQRRRRLLLMAAVTAAVILLALSSRNSHAASASGTAYHGVGPVLGVGVNPDQVSFGLRFYTGEISNRLDLRPGVELGVGDEQFRGAFLVDALYRFREQWDVWQPYAGGGLSLGVLNHDGNPDTPGGDEGNTEVEPGLNLIGGVGKQLKSGNLFLTELRIGIGEAPDLGLSVGWIFR